MGRNDETAFPSQPTRLSPRLWQADPVEARLRSLQRALDLAAVYQLGFGALDVLKVEARWEMRADDAVALGFVLRLRDGTRRYLQYVAAFESDGHADEEVETLPMTDERYPPIVGGGIVWHDDVGDLSRRLAA